MQTRIFKSYGEMERVHQEDFNDFPVVWLFGNKSDEEILKEVSKIGAKSIGECVSIGAGGVIKRSDIPALDRMMKRHERERTLYANNEDHLAEMILAEMSNHEYAYTHNAEEVLRALCRNESAFKDPKFVRAWEKAEKECEDAFA